MEFEGGSRAKGGRRAVPQSVFVWVSIEPDRPVSLRMQRKSQSQRLGRVATSISGRRRWDC